MSACERGWVPKFEKTKSRRQMVDQRQGCKPRNKRREKKTTQVMRDEMKM